MKENFRQFLDRLRQAGELVDLHQAVDIRHIATLVDQAKTALYFHNVIGYDMPVVSGIIRSKERATMAMGCETFGEIEVKLAQAIAKPIPPKYVKASPTREVTLVGDDVDLYKLPIPMSSIYDGGPMITAGVVIAKDPELGFNSGIYRFIVKEKSADRHRHRHARTTCGCSPSARSSAGAAADLDLDRHASVRDHRLGLSRAARRRRDGDRRRLARRAGRARALLRPSTCPTSPTPRSCWRRKSCRPAGPGRRAGSASSPG